MLKFLFTFLLFVPVIIFVSMGNRAYNSFYFDLYHSRVNDFELKQQSLIGIIKSQNEISEDNIAGLKKMINETRLKLKGIDFWLRYLEPVAYKKINGPLPIEWETEVFEKFEKPYRRIGAGLTIAQLYLEELSPNKDSLLTLLQQSDSAIKIFKQDSIINNLTKPGTFFFANRLFLLNLSAIYTTGFECPGRENVIPELESMLRDVNDIYDSFNASFGVTPIMSNYLKLYKDMRTFVSLQSKDFIKFDHYHFIKDYVNPLYAINQQLINKYRFFSKNFNDYSLNNNVTSIFDKTLYSAQSAKGIYIAVDDPKKLEEIKMIGKILFYDPILSDNGKRSCASCHKPNEYFTDTSVRTSLTFDKQGRLQRNTPTLLNAVYNHLLMLDGRHISLQNQATEVIASPSEMGCDENQILRNVMSCETYKKAFIKFKKLTPYYDNITIGHIVSAITFYYAGFSEFDSQFDRAINNREDISTEAIAGFNLFMSKAQCATCHFVPQFNGVKPPYLGSEFEVIGVPEGKEFTQISSDSGRYSINPASETLHAFRTGSIRNSSFTKPYMHNGIFNTIDEVIEFYDAGGGVGKGLKIDNQTLSTDSLRLTPEEKNALKAFIKTLDENILFQKPPKELPVSTLSKYKYRKVGGEY